MVGDFDESVKEVEHTFEVALPPRYIGDEERAITKIIRSWHFKYNTELKGVLLNSSDFKFVGELGRIIDDQPFVFWKVSGKFKVFFASPGSLLKGKINRFGNGYFGCRIANCVAATIYLPKDEPQDLVPYLKIDQEILFRVDKVEYENVFIQGSIDQESLRLTKELIPINESYQE